MSSQATAILHRKGDQCVASTMANRHKPLRHIDGVVRLVLHKLSGAHLQRPRIASQRNSRSLGKLQEAPPTSSRWALVTHLTLARHGAGRRPSGGRNGGGGHPIEEDIGVPSSPQGPPAARFDGHKNSDMVGERTRRTPEESLNRHGP